MTIDEKFAYDKNNVHPGCISSIPGKYVSRRDKGEQGAVACPAGTLYCHPILRRSARRGELPQSLLEVLDKYDFEEWGDDQVTAPEGVENPSSPCYKLYMQDKFRNLEEVWHEAKKRGAKLYTRDEWEHLRVA